MILDLFLNVLVNYLGFVNAFIGLDYIIAMMCLIAGIGFIWKLGHVKSF